jgi:hypothetical protein
MPLLALVKQSTEGNWYEQKTPQVVPASLAISYDKEYKHIYILI